MRRRLAGRRRRFDYEWPGLNATAARVLYVSTDVAARLKALERENRELRQANEILRKASAYFAR